ncbi:MAG: hypothetical protein JXB30_05150 [Anaerolineae bacterium]|nr:hypothetical protein [Anaerolineae bacterium]
MLANRAGRGLFVNVRPLGTQKASGMSTNVAGLRSAGGCLGFLWRCRLRALSDTIVARGTIGVKIVFESHLRGRGSGSETGNRAEKNTTACKDLVGVHLPNADKIIVTMDKLNTRNSAALYEAFPPKAAERILSWVDLSSVSYPDTVVGSI